MQKYLRGGENRGQLSAFSCRICLRAVGAYYGKLSFRRLGPGPFGLDQLLVRVVPARPDLRDHMLNVPLVLDYKK